MFDCIVDHVASLAQSGEVAWSVVTGVMIEVRARDVDFRCPDKGHQIGLARIRSPSPPIAPVPIIAIPPSAIAEMHDTSTMQASTMLAPALGAAEPDDLRQLGPVDRIQPAMFGHDWHAPILNHRNAERKGKVGVRSSTKSKRRRITPPPFTGDAGAIAPMVPGRPHQQTSQRSVPIRFRTKRRRTSSR